MVLTLIDSAISNSATLADPASTPAQRQHLIEQIITINPTAAREFLDQFRDSALDCYLRHLNATRTPRGRLATWNRPAETAAALVRDRRE